MNLASFFSDVSNPREFVLLFAFGGMLFGLIFGGLGMYFHHRKQAMWHELAKLALEKGQPVPVPPPDAGNGWQGENAQTSPQQTTQNRKRGLFIGGLVNIAVGGGLFFALSHIDKNAANFAAIPFFVGVALLLAGFLDNISSRKSSE